MVTAPTSEAGKSRVFDVLGLLVRSPNKVVDPTPAALYSDIDELRPTVLLDEADVLRENKAMKVVLNAGFQPGTPKRIKGKAYELFCPKAFSGIAGDRQPLTDATLSRSIQIPMRRKAPHEYAEPFHKGTATEELAPLKGGLEAWAESARRALYSATPWMPDGLSDRQRDCWEPLLAIADLIGSKWGSAARDWAVSLTRAIPKTPDEGVQILRDVRRVLEDADFSDVTWIATKALADRRNGLETREYADDLSTVQLGRRLAGFGINADHSPRREGGRNSAAQRGFTIRVRKGGEFTGPGVTHSLDMTCSTCCTCCTARHTHLVLTGEPGHSRRTSDPRCSGTMDDMLVNPLPGTSPEQLQKTLQEQHVAVLNAWSAHSGNAQASLGAYLQWTTNAVQHLASSQAPRIALS